jgi:hypothetical protein
MIFSKQSYAVFLMLAILGLGRNVMSSQNPFQCLDVGITRQFYYFSSHDALSDMDPTYRLDTAATISVIILSYRNNSDTLQMNTIFHIVGTRTFARTNPWQSPPDSTSTSHIDTSYSCTICLSSEGTLLNSVPYSIVFSISPPSDTCSSSNNSFGVDSENSEHIRQIAKCGNTSLDSCCLVETKRSASYFLHGVISETRQDRQWSFGKGILCCAYMTCFLNRYYPYDGRPAKTVDSFYVQLNSYGALPANTVNICNFDSLLSNGCAASISVIKPITPHYNPWQFAGKKEFDLRGRLISANASASCWRIYEIYSNGNTKTLSKKLVFKQGTTQAGR